MGRSLLLWTGLRLKIIILITTMGVVYGLTSDAIMSLSIITSFTDNYNEGVFYEISDTATITNNKLAHNGQASPWLFGGGIVMSSSADVEVSGNIVIVNADYGNGITALWTDRHLNYAVVGHTPPLRVENINVHNNDITYLGVLNVQEGKTPVSGAIAAAGVDEWSASGTIDGVEPVCICSCVRCNNY